MSGSKAKPGVRWLWVILGAVGAEVILLAAALAVGALFAAAGLGREWTSWTTPPLCLVILFLAGLLVGRRAVSSFTLNGALTGVAAALTFLPILVPGVLALLGPDEALPIPRELMVTLVITNGLGTILKIAGATAGGAVAGRLAKARPAGVPA